VSQTEVQRIIDQLAILILKLEVFVESGGFVDYASEAMLLEELRTYRDKLRRRS